MEDMCIHRHLCNLIKISKALVDYYLMNVVGGD
jgi:hypothetical protein